MRLHLTPIRSHSTPACAVIIRLTSAKALLESSPLPHEVEMLPQSLEFLSRRQLQLCLTIHWHSLDVLDCQKLLDAPVDDKAAVISEY